MKCIIAMTNGRAIIVEADSCQAVAESITRKGSMVPRLARIGDVYIAPQHVCSVEEFEDVGSLQKSEADLTGEQEETPVASDKNKK